MTWDELWIYLKTLPAGDYAECGVYRGDTAVRIHGAMAEGTTLYLFDSFEGHPENSEFDLPGHCKGRYSETSIELISKLCPKAVIYKGFFPSQFENVAYKKFRFVNVDCDLYTSTRHCIRFFLPRIVPGGIMRFDDYKCGDCPGCDKAVEEFHFQIMLTKSPIGWSICVPAS